jgi:uncharacterized Fe-S cluster-containing protein
VGAAAALRAAASVKEMSTRGLNSLEYSARRQGSAKGMMAMIDLLPGQPCRVLAFVPNLCSCAENMSLLPSIQKVSNGNFIRQSL